MTANSLILQSDFGLGDGAVCAMYGVAISVEPSLRVFDLCHEIPQFNIWEASYRLYQTINYWPSNTVFVSVVDPGVGSERLSVVAKTADNKYIITPNNGTLTHIHNDIGIVALREIDEKINRLPKSGESYTFHGRDIYAYTGARLAANVISFEEIGPELPLTTIVELANQQPTVAPASIDGAIDVLDVRFGNLWSNIPRQLFVDANVHYGDTLKVTIKHNGQTVYNNTMSFGRSFADSRIGEPLLYVNSLDKIGVGINQGSFASAHKIGTGINWTISIQKQ